MICYKEIQAVKEDVRVKSNFAFLNDTFPVLGKFGELAEKYLYSDSNSCLMKLGMIGETIVHLIFTYDRIPLPRDNTAVKRIDALFREGMITRDLADILQDADPDGIQPFRMVHADLWRLELQKSAVHYAFRKSRTGYRR